MTDEEALELFKEALWEARMRGIKWAEMGYELNLAWAEEQEALEEERMDRESYGDPDEAYDNARLGERGLLG